MSLNIRRTDSLAIYRFRERLLVNGAIGRAHESREGKTVREPYKIPVYGHAHDWG